MKGHIRERSPATGKRKRKWHSFRGTKRQAQIESARLIPELQGGGYLEPTKTTFVQFLDQWLGHIKVHVSPRTHERYTEIIRKHIAPMLGAVQLTKLRPAQIAAAYSEAHWMAAGTAAAACPPIQSLHAPLNQAGVGPCRAVGDDIQKFGRSSKDR